MVPFFGATASPYSRESRESMHAECGYLRKTTASVGERPKVGNCGRLRGFGLHFSRDKRRLTFRTKLPTYTFCGLISGGHRFPVPEVQQEFIRNRRSTRLGNSPRFALITKSSDNLRSSRVHDAHPINGVRTTKYNYRGLMIQIERA
ncbi:hypothetical protein V9T40_000378 [Parthenolecanium corni]|uniref:Uncharacterized protein n=1 Tax=Parthenolecanium corni TaxID=536013 RepID=A0AAN9Y0F6_9HEMI